VQLGLARQGKLCCADHGGFAFCEFKSPAREVESFRHVLGKALGISVYKYSVSTYFLFELVGSKSMMSSEAGIRTASGGERHSAGGTMASIVEAFQCFVQDLF